MVTLLRESSLFILIIVFLMEVQLGLQSQFDVVHMCGWWLAALPGPRYNLGLDEAADR